MKQDFPTATEAAALAARLSQRQRECLLLVSGGLTSKEIGRFLSLSPSTVDNHLNAATEKLGCSSRAVAARILDLAARSEMHGGAEATPESGKARQSYIVPPLGGPANEASPVPRLAQIGLIAIAATMAFAAITITIAGIVELFSA